MPYTFTSLALVWIGVLGLVALAGSGIVTGSGVLALVGAALALPALLTLAKPRAPVPIPTAHTRVPLESCATDVNQWENEGGARRTA